MVQTRPSLSYVLDSNHWYCSCGADFDEPEQLVGHRTSIRNAKQDISEHKQVGFGPGPDAEPILKVGHKVWKGKWRDILAKWYPEDDAPAEEERSPEDDDLSVEEYGRAAALLDEAFDGLDDDEYDDGAPSSDYEDLEEKQEGRGTRQHKVKVQYRPQVFEMDEAVVHLYHLHLAAAERMGVRYRPPLGEWIRQVVFQFSIEHPELVDLSSILTQQEREAIAVGSTGGRN